MEVKKISGLNLTALALILFLLITSNSGLENEWHYIRNRRDVATVVESDPITTSKAVNPFIGEGKKREKRFVFLLPLLGGLTAMEMTAAVGVGAAAVMVASQHEPISIPRIDLSPAIYMPASKPKSSTQEKPGKGQSTDGPKTGPKPAPKADEITAFRGLERAKPKTPVQNGGGLRPRWKDGKGKIYEWDSKKGEVEVYDKRGKNHEGGFDPYENPPRRVSDPVPSREVEP